MEKLTQEERESLAIEALKKNLTYRDISEGINASMSTVKHFWKGLCSWRMEQLIKSFIQNY